MKPKPGQDAPDFTMEADDGSTVSRESLLGERYVLYFYPKDDTTGCTAQACSMRDNYERVTSAGIRVFGVSPDSIKSHVKFRDKYDLPFTLLADTDHHVAEQYGVWGEKKYRGRSYLGVKRWTFVIDEDGNVKKVFPDVKPAEHADNVLAVLKA